jgi:hypothetical protein
MKGRDTKNSQLPAPGQSLPALSLSWWSAGVLVVAVVVVGKVHPAVNDREAEAAVEVLMPIRFFQHQN